MLQRKPHSSQFGERQQRMTIVHHAARDVDVRNRVAVEKQLLLYVIEKQRCDGKRAKQQREARVVALLVILLFYSRALSASSHLGAFPLLDPCAHIVVRDRFASLHSRYAVLHFVLEPLVAIDEMIPRVRSGATIVLAARRLHSVSNPNYLPRLNAAEHACSRGDERRQILDLIRSRSQYKQCDVKISKALFPFHTLVYSDQDIKCSLR